jgi:hypothetical protein
VSDFLGVLNNAHKRSSIDVSVDRHKALLFRHTMSEWTLRAVCDENLKSNMNKWDSKVVQDCMKRLSVPFKWFDLHWPLEKAELLRRTEEWNTALEHYCNDEGLAGPEREAVIAMHRACPFAPCAHHTCSHVEKKVKQYLKCSSCKLVAYCSRQCQVDHWKTHKPFCLNMRSSCSDNIDVDHWKTCRPITSSSPDNLE